MAKTYNDTSISCPSSDVRTVTAPQKCIKLYFLLKVLDCLGCRAYWFEIFRRWIVKVTYFVPFSRSV